MDRGRDGLKKPDVFASLRANRRCEPAHRAGRLSLGITLSGLQAGTSSIGWLPIRLLATVIFTALPALAARVHRTAGESKQSRGGESKS
jgi:hypothetical protein